MIAFALKNWGEVNRYVDDHQREQDRQLAPIPSIDMPKLQAKFAEIYSGQPPGHATPVTPTVPPPVGP